jgi:hypothetical protein
VVDASTAIEPEVYGMLRATIVAELRNRSNGRCRWVLKPTIFKDPDLRIDIAAAELVFPSLKDLQEVRSTYLSHYESVPNPVKSSLKIQLEGARVSADLAESFFNSAVSSHNLYPTQYSLINVNSSRTSYVMAIDRYNDLVQRYNAEPTTVRSAVYTPYSFKEGTVRFGWSCEASSLVGKDTVRFQMNLIKSDLVRIGTRETDRELTRRRDDGLDLNISVEAAVQQLGKVTTGLVDSSAPSLAKLDRLLNTNITSVDEAEVLRWLLHPFGVQKNLAGDLQLDPWICTAGSAITFPSSTLQVPEILLASPQAQTTSTQMSPSSLASEMESMICQIKSSDGGAEFSGSGILISGDGLILTCAHVLVGDQQVVMLPAVDSAREYEVEVVFVNEAADCALIRAKGLKTQKWANIRLDREATKGEEIVALGNPSIPGGIATAAISKGIVAKPKLKLRDQEQMVCDVTISSGSSGGPIISLVDGKIVGVVVAIQSAGINPTNISASGFSCIAVPSDMLKKHLGIKYQP